MNITNTNFTDSNINAWTWLCLDELWKQYVHSESPAINSDKSATVWENTHCLGLTDMTLIMMGNVKYPEKGDLHMTIPVVCHLFMICCTLWFDNQQEKKKKKKHSLMMVFYYTCTKWQKQYLLHCGFRLVCLLKVKISNKIPGPPSSYIALYI